MSLTTVMLFFARVIGWFRQDIAGGRTRIATLFAKVTSFSFTAVVRFILAPFLLLWIVVRPDSSLARRAIAATGLVFSSFACFFAGRFLAKWWAPALVASEYSFSLAIVMLFDNDFSNDLRLISSFIVFNTSGLLFLKSCSREVLDDLKKI